MRRRLFNISAGFSLSICIAMCVLWIRSYRVGEKEWCDDFSRSRAAGGEGYCLESDNARLAFFHRFIDETDDNSIPHATIPWHFKYHRMEHSDMTRDLRPAGMDDGIVWEHFGFACISKSKNDFIEPAGTDRMIRFPDWFLAGILAVLPIAKFFRWWKNRRRLALGPCCEACGYDLRVTPERCPECGRAV